MVLVNSNLRFVVVARDFEGRSSLELDDVVQARIPRPRAGDRPVRPYEGQQAHQLRGLVDPASTRTGNQAEAILDRLIQHATT